ncbi:MAG: enoyl-CoA hydratase-related protein [Chloroflexota bacterium]|nr:enoyl-CoA hydratase-related protein [Chloroflexota bacterium]
MEVTERLAAKLAAGASLALGRSKELVNQSFAASLETQLELESRYQFKTAMTEDLKEGLTAFFEKRKALFKGK